METRFLDLLKAGKELRSTVVKGLRRRELQQRRADDNIALVNGIRILDNGFGMANSVAN